MSNITTPHHVTHQPMSLTSMDPYFDHYHDEKSLNPPSYTSHDCECENPHNTCHKSRLYRLLIPAILSVVMIATIIFVSCIKDLAALGVFGPDEGVIGLGKQALGARDTTGSNNGSFLNNKLYLIVIFVGLFLVLILAIMLSAWCCRGSFENPCCCPCYLCACCGGLACLDCIACGLCAEAV